MWESVKAVMITSVNTLMFICCYGGKWANVKTFMVELGDCAKSVIVVMVGY